MDVVNTCSGLGVKMTRHVKANSHRYKYAVGRPVVIRSVMASRYVVMNALTTWGGTPKYYRRCIRDVISEHLDGYHRD